VLPPLDRRFYREAGSTSYTVRGLIPGRFTVHATGSATLDSRPKAITLTGSPSTVTQDLVLGPKPGRYTVRFVSGSAPIANIGITARDAAGDVTDIQTQGTSKGRATADGLRPGTWRYDTSSFGHAGETTNVPAADGPWWFGAVSRTFTVRAGRTTNGGTVALQVRSTP
jgi:hypothetical protein